MDRELEGKIAIVTGAGRGLGRAEALGLALAGARVVVNDLGVAWDGSQIGERPAESVVAEIKDAGGEAVASFNDVATWGGAETLIRLALETYGDLDVLVCNAGILRDRMSFNITEEDWTRVLKVHLNGHFYPARNAARHWRERAKKAGRPVPGSLLMTTSESGLFGNTGQVNYNVAKAGIAMMALTLARELRQYGINVNSVAPRARTRLTEQTFGTFHGVNAGFDPWDPAHISPWVTFLCTHVGHSISGQTFLVFGGTVQRIAGYQYMERIHSADGWTIERLTEQHGRLFPSLREPQPLPDFELPSLCSKL